MNKKLILSLVFLLVCATPLLAQIGDSTQVTQTTVIEKGVGLGAVIAVVAPWSRNESIRALFCSYKKLTKLNGSLCFSAS